MDKDNKLSIKCQSELLEVCRCSFYYVSREDSSQNHELMKLIDKQYLETPFYGVPRMTAYLRSLGYNVKGGLPRVDIVMPKLLKRESYYLKKKRKARCRSRA